MTGAVHRDRVRLPGRETDIEIGSGLRRRLWLALGEQFPSAWRIAIVIDRRVADLWPLDRPDVGPEMLVVRAPPGEAAKTRAVLARMQDRLLDLTREEPVVAIGGGALLDAAGFAAATVRRGLPWIAVPTTVVGPQTPPSAGRSP